MRRSGVRIPLAPPQADIRSGCRFFVCLGTLVRCLVLCCSWRRWCSGRRRARPPARLGGLTSFGAAPRSPPVPSGPSGALHTGGAWSLICGSARRLEAQPSPAAAHRHRGCALRTLRRPPHRRRLVADVWLGASFRCPARPRHRPLAPRLATHVKPSSPLLACAPSPVKPMTPLQARYTCFRRNCGEQRRHGFHGDVPVSPHWCRRFHLAAR